MKILLAALVLPGPVLLYIPFIILYLTKFKLSTPAQWIFYLAILLIICGMSLSLTAVYCFKVRGDGTPAPWDPPQRLVITGPYCYVRNPMLTGVLYTLLGEVLLFQSWPLGIWFVVFLMLNIIYFPLFEEPGLRKRFGSDYIEYCMNVPRWVPRLTPWKKS